MLKKRIKYERETGHLISETSGSQLHAARPLFRYTRWLHATELFAVQIPVRKKHSFRSAVILIRTARARARAHASCEREREILASLLFDLTVKQSDAPSSAKKRREGAFLVLPWDDPSSHCGRIRTYRSSRWRNPSRTYRRRQTAPRMKKRKKKKTKNPGKLDSDDDGGSVGNDWPREQINSPLGVCTWRLHNTVRSECPSCEFTVSFAWLRTVSSPAHKKTISQALIRARPTSSFL